MKSFMLRKEDVSREWYQVDASGKVLGRLATKVAEKLMGKGKPSHTFHIDNGDFVVVTNAKDVLVTGKKARNKVYYRHSEQPGSLKARTFEETIAKRPTLAVELAVKRMLPKNRIGRHMMTRLRIFEGDTHDHSAQKPRILEI